MDNKEQEEGPKLKKHKAAAAADDVMECCICNNPLLAPWMCAGDKGCGKSLCQSCVFDAETKMSRFDKCPLCQVSPIQFKPNRDLADLLGKTRPQPDFFQPKKTIKEQILELYQPLLDADPEASLSATTDRFPFWLPFMEMIHKGRDTLKKRDTGNFLNNCVLSCPGGADFTAFLIAHGGVFFNSSQCNYKNVFVCKFENNRVLVFRSQ